MCYTKEISGRGELRKRLQQIAAGRNFAIGSSKLKFSKKGVR
jgi:hypothetical protein